MTNLNGKVALVTGAGGGLGRAYAKLFAELGAKVVVNDLGGNRNGEGTGSTLADAVVAEIKAAGGEAVANYGSVSNVDDANAMVKAAIDTFGQIDIVVNNAGVLRDKTLVKMTDDMWNLVIDVHLKGTYLVTKAAILSMKSGGGRIINTSSIAGLKGNYGQGNYGAAKAGIAGFTRSIALEVRKLDITVNAIAPVAKTRMTDDIDMVPDAFEPEDIAPLVAWLASDDAKQVTGRVFGAHGSHFFEYNVEQTPGIDLGEKRWTAADVGSQFDAITAKAASTNAAPSNEIRDLFAALPATFKSDAAGNWATQIQFDVGGTPYGLTVAKGVASFVDGKVDAPKAKVVFDGAETVLEMASGSLPPEQAFMSGRVSTDNMGALMKFGKFFDLAAAAATSGSESLAKSLLSALPATLKTEKAGDWSERISFDIAGVLFALNIEKGVATFIDGTLDNPTGKVTFDSDDTLMAMANGQLAPEQAFMSGKVSTDNMGMLMKFGQFFDLKAAAATLSGGSVTTMIGLNSDCIGKKYRGAAAFVEPSHITNYTNATDETNVQFNGENPIAPPIYPVRPLLSVLTQAILDPELNADLLRLVHGEQDMVFHRHLKPWDLATARAEIGTIESKSSGELMKIHQTLLVDGDIVTEVTSGVFIRGDGAPGEKKTQQTSESQPTIYEETQVVADDQPARYANASLDQNPIHVDASVAKAAGHPSVILHGLCTMAFASRAVVNGVCDGDANRLKRLCVRFSKPVLPGWELTTRLWSIDGENNKVGLEVVNQDGVAVISNAFAEFV